MIEPQLINEYRSIDLRTDTGLYCTYTSVIPLVEGVSPEVISLAIQGVIIRSLPLALCTATTMPLILDTHHVRTVMTNRPTGIHTVQLSPNRMNDSETIIDIQQLGNKVDVMQTISAHQIPVFREGSYGSLAMPTKHFPATMQGKAIVDTTETIETVLIRDGKSLRELPYATAMLEAPISIVSGSDINQQIVFTRSVDRTGLEECAIMLGDHRTGKSSGQKVILQPGVPVVIGPDDQAMLRTDQLDITQTMVAIYYPGRGILFHSIGGRTCMVICPE